MAGQCKGAGVFLVIEGRIRLASSAAQTALAFLKFTTFVPKESVFSGTEQRPDKKLLG